MSYKIQKTADNEVIATVEALTDDARGMARIDGKITFIEGALPNEQVAFHYSKRHKDYDEGQLFRVIDASKDRVLPECQHFDICGGCALQHFDADAQILSKESVLLNLLQRNGKVIPEEILAPLTADRWNYRYKARLSTRFVRKKGTTLVGFRERHQPRYIADIQSCAIIHQKVSNALPDIRLLINQLESPSSIAQIELSAGDDDAALIFRNLSPCTDHDIALFKKFGEDYGFLIFLQPKGPDSMFQIYPENHSGYLNYTLPDYDLTYYAHPADFTQINLSMNRKMVRQALHELQLTSEDDVLDLFCGLGNFSLPMAKFSHSVVGIEGSEEMVARASMNALKNHVKNATFLAKNLDDDDSLAMLIKKSWTKILLDPPRSGALSVVRQLNNSQIKRIVYVSCNPATLARDAGVLVHEKGYRLVKAGVMDMFPHTAHIEAMAVFERK